MYCIFFLLIPGMFWALRNDRLYYLAAISGGLWLAASQGYGMTALPGVAGYFDLMSWQVLFVARICFGFIQVPTIKKLSTSTSWMAVCLALVGIFFIVRRWHFLTGQQWSPYLEWLFRWKRTLPLGCLVNFMAFSTVVYRFRRPLSAVATSSPGKAIAFLGQHSLQVFVWSVSATMLVSGPEYRWIAPSCADHPLAATGLILASCFVPAWLHAEWRGLRHKVAPSHPAQVVS